jgi:hypothetical protein
MAFSISCLAARQFVRMTSRTWAVCRPCSCDTSRNQGAAKACIAIVRDLSICAFVFSVSPDVNFRSGLPPKYASSFQKIWVGEFIGSHIGSDLLQRGLVLFALSRTELTPKGSYICPGIDQRQFRSFGQKLYHTIARTGYGKKHNAGLDPSLAVMLGSAQEWVA